MVNHQNRGCGRTPPPRSDASAPRYGRSSRRSHESPRAHPPPRPSLMGDQRTSSRSWPCSPAMKTWTCASHRRTGWLNAARGNEISRRWARRAGVRWRAAIAAGKSAMMTRCQIVLSKDTSPVVLACAVWARASCSARRHVEDEPAQENVGDVYGAAWALASSKPRLRAILSTLSTGRIPARARRSVLSWLDSPQARMARRDVTLRRPGCVQAGQMAGSHAPAGPQGIGPSRISSL